MPAIPPFSLVLSPPHATDTHMPLRVLRETRPVDQRPSTSQVWTCGMLALNGGVTDGGEHFHLKVTMELPEAR